MKKIGLIIASLMMLVMSLFTTSIRVSADDEAVTLNSVTDLKVEQNSTGEYVITFTDSNDPDAVDYYKVQYNASSLHENEEDMFETIEGSGSVLTQMNKFYSGTYLVKVAAIAVTEEIEGVTYADSAWSNGIDIYHSKPVFKSGVTLDNLVSNKKIFKTESKSDQYLEDGYEFALYRRYTYDGRTGIYAYEDSSVSLEGGIIAQANHIYYFGFEYKFNSDYSTVFNGEMFAAYINEIPVAVNENPIAANRFLFPMIKEFNPTGSSYYEAGRQSHLVKCNETKLLDNFEFRVKKEQTYPSTGPNSLEAYSIRNIIMFDLTEIYGYGNEPTASAIDSFINVYGYVDYLELSTNAIIGPQNIKTSCTNVLSSSDIISKYETIEESSIYILESNYSENATKPGTYYATLAYKDSSGTINKRMINIVVTDDINPVIELIDGGDELISNISAPLTSAEILSKVKVTDNADSNLKSALTVDATNYLSNQKTEGKYPVQLQVTDSSGNTASKTIYIRVVNDLGPVFDAPSVIYKSTDIVFNANDVLNTISSVIDQDGNYLDLWIDDELNSDHFLVVQDTLTGHANKEGSYIVKVKAWDVEGRVSYHTFTINVVEDIPNIIMYSNTIYVSFDVTLTNKDIKNILKRCGLTNKSDDNAIVTFPVNEYEDNNYAAGQSYDVKVRYVCANGTEENYNLVIKVLDSETMAIDSSSWISRNWGWVVGAAVLLIVIAAIVNKKR